MSWWPATPETALNRPDGSDLLILSPQMPHILDKCFWLLPFAIRSDATTAITNAGASLAPQLGFLNGLLAEHELPAAREELKRLWTKWIEMRMVLWPPLSGRVLHPLLLHACRRGMWPPHPTPHGASEDSLCLPCAINGLHGKFVTPCRS